jgi:hypothetical protein
MKNLTITLDESTLAWARVEAAKRNSSVSRMVGEMLTAKMREEDEYTRAQQGWLDKQRVWRSDGSAYPSREQTYER